MGARDQPARLVGGWLSLEVGKSVETQQRALVSSHSSKSGGFDPDLAHPPVRVMCSRGDCMAGSLACSHLEFYVHLEDCLSPSGSRICIFLRERVRHGSPRILPVNFFELV